MTYTAYLNEKEYKILVKRRRDEDEERNVKTRSYDIRYQLPNEEEITVFSYDSEGTLYKAPKVYGSVNIKLNDFSLYGPTVREFFTYSGKRPSLFSKFYDVQGCF